uniref:Tyrosine decarboxylase n=1 Tax=Cacopsylla melanoneura TaxID=428564 RepID=A0A8D9DUA4_9HEMI
MDVEEFRERGRQMVDYICEYMTTIEKRRVTPNVNPGWLKTVIPNEAPYDPEPFDEIMKDVEEKIMPGVTHWQHPRFHAYFPSGNSYPSILADMLSDAIGCIGFSWAASPSCTELETIVLDWLGKAIGLPEKFLMYPSSKGTFPNDIDMNLVDDHRTPANQQQSLGGGVIQSSASECIFVCMLSARAQAISKLKKIHPFVDEGVLLSKLMAYCSKEAHSCVEKAAMMAFVRLKILEPDDKNSLRGATLRQVMQQDETMGYIPFFVSTTLGTTSCCSFDNLAEIGPVAKEFEVWLHVDGAYAGSSFICPEFRPFMNGIEYADSFNVNVNKFMLTAFDCSCLWVADRYKLTSALVVDPLYLQHGHEGAIDYRHWGIPLSRRFRSLKLWFVIRSYGLSGLQKYIRRHCELAKLFEAKVRRDPRFEISNDVRLGLVCFRLKGDGNIVSADQINRKLLEDINASGKLHMVPASVNDKYVIRFCVTAQNANEKDIDIAWKIIQEFASTIVTQSIKEEEQDDEVFELQERKRKDDLAYKRSFFVRMVSDPKIYNPKIAVATPTSRRPTCLASSAEEDEETESGGSSEQGSYTPTSSWISWPLAFLLQSRMKEEAERGKVSDVPVRFRHLDTMVHLKKSRKEMSEIHRGVSASPIVENTASNSISEESTVAASSDNDNLQKPVLDKENNKTTVQDKHNKSPHKDKGTLSNGKGGVKHSARITTTSNENHVEVRKLSPSGNENSDKASDEDTETVTTRRSTKSVITVNKIFTPEQQK